jgi:formylglycine-generating enzyme required for sulfatase activity/DNA-binding winged helix-turn-helix (wHTH) protein
MDHIVQRVLRFDRFALDLTRGCLRAGDHEIDLRPKTFEVLCYLAENAARLVPKQELFEAVWPNVTVCDDSLVQCIRELRQKLGDDDRRLIKTVSRRGYLLDATVSPDAAQHLVDRQGVVPFEAPPTPVGMLQRIGKMQVRKLRAWAIVPAVVLCAAWSATYLAGWPVHLANPGYFDLTTAAPGMPQPRPSFKDCADCPEMVALPAGEFIMGSPESERGRLNVEGLPRAVSIPKRIAIGKFEVTFDQFSVFVAETGIAVRSSCKVVAALDRTPIAWGPPEASFRQPGFEVKGSQPVVCVSWHDAQAYVAWLRRRTGKPYRLPTEAEWEYAARAGTRTSYSFGNDENALCGYARFADLSSQFGWRDGCRSDVVTYGPLPVGSLKPNPWGLFDMHGNAWELVEDCWTANAGEIPTDGSAFSHPGNCEVGVERGGSFAAGSRRVRSAIRAPVNTMTQAYNMGFRVAISLGD